MVKATNSVNVPSRTQNKCLAACTADFFVREKQISTQYGIFIVTSPPERPIKAKTEWQIKFWEKIKYNSNTIQGFRYFFKYFIIANKNIWLRSDSKIKYLALIFRNLNF